MEDAAAGPDNAERRQFHGWLRKTKSRASRRLFGSTNQRYFTLDFDARIFYYAKDEKSTKNVSVPVSFRQFRAVELLGREEEMHYAIVDESMLEPCDDTSCSEDEAPSQIQHCDSSMSVGTSASKGSRISRMFSKLSRRPAERHGFVLHLQAKSMELVCSTKEQAQQWIVKINEAMALMDKQAVSTAPGSSRRTSPSPPCSEGSNGRPPRLPRPAASAPAVSSAADQRQADFDSDSSDE